LTPRSFYFQYGEALWDEDTAHPSPHQNRTLQGSAEPNTVALITGRRRDQAATRADMPVFELDGQQRLQSQL